MWKTLQVTWSERSFWHNFFGANKKTQTKKTKNKQTQKPPSWHDLKFFWHALKNTPWSDVKTFWAWVEEDFFWKKHNLVNFLAWFGKLHSRDMIFKCCFDMIFKYSCFGAILKFLDISWTISAIWYPPGNLNLIVSFTLWCDLTPTKKKIGCLWF